MRDFFDLMPWWCWVLLVVVLPLALYCGYQAEKECESPPRNGIYVCHAVSRDFTECRCYSKDVFR